MLVYISNGRSRGDVQMKMLKMSGYPITNIHDYNKYFNIYDVLKYNKEFMSFALSHFANLSKTFSYCAAMVYTAIENRLPIIMRDDIYKETNDVDLDVCDSGNFWNNPFAFCHVCSPSAEVLNRTKEIAKQFEPKINDIVFKKAMLISIAAFAFLDNNYIDTNINLNEAKKSFLGQKDNEKENVFKLRFEDDMSDYIQTIILEPSSQIYSCLLFDQGDFTKIKTFRIVASRKINSLSNRTVKISVGDQQINIPAGEHMYVNTINGQVAHILDKSQWKKGYTLQNIGIEKDILKFDNERSPKLEFYGNEYISSFDFSTSDNSIIYLNNLRLCLDACTSPVLLEQLKEYSALNLVEVKIVNTRFYLLKSDGELVSNDLKCNGHKNVHSIDWILRSYQ